MAASRTCAALLMTCAVRASQSVLLWLVLFLFCSGSAAAAVELPHMLGNNMVFQSGAPIPVWGHAQAGVEVTVTLGNAAAHAHADGDGVWQVTLPAAPPGGPFTLTATDAKGPAVTVTNVMIGEVWICAGQQAWTQSIASGLNGNQEVAAATSPDVRVVWTRTPSSGVPLNDIDIQWNVCKSDNAWSIPALAYFFARDLHQKLGVAVAVIVTASDGPGIDQFIPAAAFHLFPEFADTAARIDDANATFTAGYGEALERLAAFLPQARRELAAGSRLDPPPEYHHTLDNWAPAAAYNGWVAPFTHMPIAGVLWYHGESNWGDGHRYGIMTEMVIRGWRTAWGRDDLPFYYVQLPPFPYDNNRPLRLPELWEGQTRVMKDLPHTGMVVLNDQAVRPENRLVDTQEAGRRLMLWALTKTYGKPVVCSGPLYQSHAVTGSTVTITFASAEGLKTRDGKDPTWFTIAGADKVFVPATATISGSTVTVSAAGVSAPQAVRFAWNQEAKPNLMNQDGLPGEPFRTDDWPLP